MPHWNYILGDHAARVNGYFWWKQGNSGIIRFSYWGWVADWISLPYPWISNFRNHDIRCVSHGCDDENEVRLGGDCLQLGTQSHCDVRTFKSIWVDLSSIWIHFQAGLSVMVDEYGLPTCNCPDSAMEYSKENKICFCPSGLVYTEGEVRAWTGFIVWHQKIVSKETNCGQQFMIF